MPEAPMLTRERPGQRDEVWMLERTAGDHEPLCDALQPRRDCE
jgi:hypothetical protein